MTKKPFKRAALLPVVRTRPDSELASATRTKEQDTVFLMALADCSSVRDAAKLAEYEFLDVYRYANEDPEFEKAMLVAQEAAVQKMESEADRRGMHGVQKDVYYQGEVVGQETVYSDALLMMRLKALKPDKYRERLDVTGDDGVKAPGRTLHDDKKARTPVINVTIERKAKSVTKASE